MPWSWRSRESTKQGCFREIPEWCQGKYEMDEWITTAKSLFDRLKLMPYDENRAETLVLEYLTNLLAAAGSGERVAMDERIFELKHFWLQSIPWCSSLSKDIERILIQYDEYTD
jgi:hypothetical protein